MPKRITKKKHNPSQTIFTRFLLIVAVFTVWIGIIGVRLVHLQVNQSDWLREKAQVQRRDEHKSKTLRGSILDREGRVLALSINVKSLYADPSEIDDVAATAKTLAAALKMKPQEIQKTLQDAKNANKRFVWLARKMDADAEQKLNDKLKDTELKKADEPRFKGLHWKEEQKRSYPYGTLAAQVIGFSNLDDIGQAGIEQSQEQSLKGAVIKTWRDRDRLGRVYDESDNDAEQREPPKSIVLTISRSIQYKTEEALKKGVEAANAKSGVAIVMDPKTGEILAMANYPTFDPNKFGDSPAENYANKAIQNIYSPGSVFKLVTYGTALQNNLITPDGQFDCGGGVIKVAGHEFRDPHCGKTLTYTDALAISSNIGAIKTGMRVGKNDFYNSVRQFGFGDATGIELPAEAKGQLRPPQNWNGDSLASMSIGYEIGVTALQTATAFATIANDGIRVKPHIIKEIRQADEQTSSPTDAEKIPVVSQNAAQSLRRMLRQVVLKGTGRRAQLDGYSCAGKTGTAWKYDEKRKKISENKYVSSFIGMAPADNPSVVIAVVLDEPQGARRDGGQVSAPIFHDIAEQILPELGVVPDGNVRQETAQDIPSEVEPKIASANNEKTADKNDKFSASGEKNALSKTPKEKKTKSGDDDKDAPKAKPVALVQKPKSEAKNKSSAKEGKGKT